jgi:pimeloyl-ACP methyl ester carboxylesterase
LYVAHRSSDAELRDEPLVRELLAAEPEADFYACDVRGIGESQPETCTPGSFEDAYGSDYFYAAHALMLDRPYLGQRTQDVLAVLRWLRESGYIGVHLAGRGWGALPALFAAVLDPWAAPVTLKHGLNSYAEVAESESYHWPLALLPAGLLKFFDLTDCYRELESRKLRRIEPWGADPA